ncbi:MAG: NADH-quinone oxidoreductase subunit M [Magnetococcus sp. DMHC-6]
MHNLTILLFFPLFGAGIIALLRRDQEPLIRYVAMGISLGTLLFAFGLLALFDPSSASLQLAEYYQWNPRLGTHYSLGIDGFSYPMVLLTTVLNFIAILASTNIKNQVKGYYMLLLALETATLGVFMAQDWIMFYLFWEMTLIPLFFLIDKWGGANRGGASINFVLYTMGGSVFILISLLALMDATHAHTFEISVLVDSAQHLGVETTVFIFIGFLVGFGVKIPIFPIHGWLPLAHVEAPSPVSILLSGILLKMGAYGLIRAVQMLPMAVEKLQPFLVALAFINLIYGALLAWRQRDLKGMIAYSSISHMGVVLLGIATLNVLGWLGAIMQMVAHGLVAAILFLMIGLLYERTHTRDVEQYSSLILVTPHFAFFTVLAFVAAIGLPGTTSFIAELHILLGGFERWGWWMILLMLGVLINATYAVRTIGRLFTGPVRPAMQHIHDLLPHERIAASILVIGILVLGIYPDSALKLMRASVDHVGFLLVGSY